MNNNPLVSVVLILYNTEKFIQEAIESVLAQTYDNWELLLVDDGSSDRSTQIALQYAQQYPEKVFYLQHEGHQNLGRSATRNLGILNAKGKYLAFLDSDDVFLPTKLEQQIAILNSQPNAVMLYGLTLYWYSWTGNAEDIQRDYIKDPEEFGVEMNALVKPPILLNLLLQGKTCTPCTCSVLIKTEVIKDVGVFEDSFRGMYDDQVFFSKLFLKHPVFIVSQCWDRYRKHPDSCVTIARQAGQEDVARLFFLNWLEKYLTEQGFKDTKVWHSLQKALWPYRYPILFKLIENIQHLWGKLKFHLKSIARRALYVKV